MIGQLRGLFREILDFTLLSWTLLHILRLLQAVHICHPTFAGMAFLQANDPPYLDGHE